MKKTTNYDLKKPEVSDYYNIEDQNSNMDAIDGALSQKVDKEEGKQLSTEDYTTAEKTKLGNMQTWASDKFALSNHNHNNLYSPLTHNHNTAYLGKIAKAADANLLDGHDSSYFATKGHNHSGVYEPKVTKKSGFNLDKSDSVTSSSSVVLATLKAVKTAYDKAVSAWNLANGKLGATAKAVDSDKLDGKHSSEFASSSHNHNGVYEPVISKKTGFNLNKSDSVNSTSSGYLATTKAVKTAYDKAVSAWNLANSKLGATAKAVDSDKLDGRDGKYYFNPSNYGFQGNATSNFTLSTGNSNQVITVNSTGNVVVSIPVGMPMGSQIILIRTNTGVVSIRPLSGVALYSIESKRNIKDRYGMVSLVHKGGNIWYLSGSLE